MRLQVAHASRAHPGEAENGDLAFVAEYSNQYLLAVVDGLGHGPQAALAAQAARACLSSSSAPWNPEELMLALDHALRKTRGAAATACVFEAGKLSYAGVGNVAMRSRGASVGLIATPGILGRRTHRVRVFETPLGVGDRIAVFSDGISARIDLDDFETMDPSAACGRIVERLGRPTDDATVLLCDVIADGERS